MKVTVTIDPDNEVDGVYKGSATSVRRKFLADARADGDEFLAENIDEIQFLEFELK